MYINVIDAFFEVYVDMDKKITDLETLHNLTLFPYNSHAYISAEISELEPIQEKCRTFFTDKKEKFNIISCLFNNKSSFKYLKISSYQFIWECCSRKWTNSQNTDNVEKEQTSTSEQTWSFEKCIPDKSAGQISTHIWVYLQSVFEAKHSFSFGSLLKNGVLVLLSSNAYLKGLNLKQNRYCLIF